MIDRGKTIGLIIGGGIAGLLLVVIISVGWTIYGEFSPSSETESTLLTDHESSEQEIWKVWDSSEEKRRRFADLAPDPKHPGFDSAREAVEFVVESIMKDRVDEVVRAGVSFSLPIDPFGWIQNAVDAGWTLTEGYYISDQKEMTLFDPNDPWLDPIPALLVVVIDGKSKAPPMQFIVMPQKAGGDRWYVNLMSFMCGPGVSMTIDEPEPEG